MNVPSPFDLHGTSAVVTGASPGGLGYAAARSLLAHGARVVLSDRPGTEDELRAAVARLPGEVGAAESDGTTSWCVADVADEADLARLARTAEDTLGGVDVLVHTAGMMMRKPTLETSREEFERVISVNLTGTWLVDRAFAAGMIGRGHGKIINTSSVYTSIVGPLPEPAYYASKAGVANMTRGLAAEWGRDGVTVNCLAPGVFYPTRMTAPLAEQPGRLEQMTQRTMLGRLGDPDRDIGGTVVWLASSASDYVTGQILLVDGGWSAW